MKPCVIIYCVLFLCFLLLFVCLFAWFCCFVVFLGRGVGGQGGAKHLGTFFVELHAQMLKMALPHVALLELLR